jgi:DNA-binding LacI/PurR family transcriptional regulator
LDETSGHERLDAFRAAMARRGLDVPDACLRGGRWSSEAGREGTLELLAADPPVTGIVASSVELALGCMFACRERGVRIPTDLALTSFDDAYFAELLDPPLTGVGYDPMEVGRAAAALLVEAMQGVDGDRRAELKVPVTLVTRESCGCTP